MSAWRWVPELRGDRVLLNAHTDEDAADPAPRVEVRFLACV